MVLASTWDRVASCDQLIHVGAILVLLCASMFALALLSYPGFSSTTRPSAHLQVEPVLVSLCLKELAQLPQAATLLKQHDLSKNAIKSMASNSVN